MTLNHLLQHSKECCKDSKRTGTNQPMDDEEKLKPMMKTRNNLAFPSLGERPSTELESSKTGRITILIWPEVGKKKTMLVSWLIESLINASS